MADVLRSSAVLADRFCALSHALASGADPDEVLHRIVAVAVKDMPGHLGCTLVRVKNSLRPLASSDDDAAAADTAQSNRGQGPTLDAVRTASVVHVPDLDTEFRWPLLRRNTQEVDRPRAVLSFPVNYRGQSAITFYAPAPQTFHRDAHTLAEVFVAHTQVLFNQLAAATKVANLLIALDSSREIGAAVGVLMVTRQVDYDQALGLLQQTNQVNQYKLSDVAAEVLRTGTLPDRSPHQRHWSTRPSVNGRTRN